MASEVLAIDDDPDSLELVTFVLSQSGAVVTAVPSAHEALKALEMFKPDVLVSDIGMPEEDGYMLMRRVRALGSNSGGQIPA